MNVLYTCDNNYVWLMGISMISLFENNKEIVLLDVFLLGENISEKSKEELWRIGEQYNRKIVIIDVPQIDVPDSLISSRWPLSAFTRLYAGQILPNCLDAVLYLDCDTIVNGSIEAIAKAKLSDKIFYGVKDCVGKRYKENIGLKADDSYINAGVLLINLKRLREVDVKESIDRFLLHYKALINYADQDILNGGFLNEIGVLEAKYNVMTIDFAHTYSEIMELRKPTKFYSEDELEIAVSDPLIIHYTTNMRIIRPWYKNSNHPKLQVFLYYFAMSPWKNRELSVMGFNAPEAKVIGYIQKMPKIISNKILGVIHSEMKPLVIKIKAKRVKE